MKSINIYITCCLFMAHGNYLFPSTATISISKSMFPSNVVPLSSGTPPATPPITPATTAAPAVAAVTTVAAAATEVKSTVVSSPAATKPPVVNPPVITPPVVTPPAPVNHPVVTPPVVTPPVVTPPVVTPPAAQATPVVPEIPAQQVLTSVYIQNNFTHDAILNEMELLTPGKTEPFIKKNLQIRITAPTNPYSRGSITAFDLTADKNNIESFNGIKSITLDDDKIVFNNVAALSSLENPITINKVEGKWVLDK